MQHDFEYVPRKEYLPVKKELELLINDVQDEVREYFTFSFTYIGSTKRKMITREQRCNIGYDFDVNIHVNDEEQEFTAEEIRNIIRRAFDSHVTEYGYRYCEDSTRVLTIKKIDPRRKIILSSCDFAIVYDCGDGRQQYIHYNKKQGSYDWEYMKQSNRQLEEKAEWLRRKGYWNEVREIYLDKKNWNDNPNKHSRSLYAETVNEVYRRYSAG